MQTFSIKQSTFFCLSYSMKKSFDPFPNEKIQHDIPKSTIVEKYDIMF